MASYGVPDATAGSLPWQWAEARLVASRNYWLATVDPAGGPHAMPVWGIWESSEQRFWFSCAADSLKARNIAANPRVVVAADDTVEVVSVEGDAEPSTRRDIADGYGRKYESDPANAAELSEFMLQHAMYVVVPTKAFGIIERHGRRGLARTPQSRSARPVGGWAVPSPADGTAQGPVDATDPTRGRGVTEDVFEPHRRRMTAVAYGMLGSVVDAEDVVQDAWLRWSTIDHTDVRNPEAFLTTIVTRLAVDELRSARHRRETYVGPWLPEPVVTEPDQDPADVVVEAEQLSMAMLTALERLNPVERAVLLLRDVFDLDYVEIAEVVEKSPGNCRQIATRARERVGEPHRSTEADRCQAEDLVAAFVEAAGSGDLDGLVGILAGDVVAWSDGGGRRRAARHPLYGAGRVARFYLNVTRQGLAQGATARIVRANGIPAVRAEVSGEVVSLLTFDVRDGQIVAIRAVLNPDKLTRV